MNDLKGRGFAEGTYWNTCIHCKGTFRGDKRATSCKGCAKAYFEIEELRTLSGAIRVYRDHFKNDPEIRKTYVNALGGWLCDYIPDYEERQKAADSLINFIWDGED